MSPDDHRLAHELAVLAGELLVGLQEAADPDEPPDRLGDRADLAAHELIVDALARARPDDFVLSEESAADEPVELRHQRVAARRAWVVDPLDGTSGFKRRSEEWAVHIALCIDGDPVVGACPVPTLGEVWSTWSPPPPSAAEPDDTRSPIMIASRSRADARAFVADLATQLGAEVRHAGGAGYKTMAVIRGEADIYAHVGAANEWDSAAPVAVARAAGLWTSRLDGSPLVYNQDDPVVPDILICRADLAEATIAAAAPGLAALRGRG